MTISFVTCRWITWPALGRCPHWTRSSLYHSTCEPTGRLMPVAEKSVPVRWRWITGTKTGVTVDVSAKNALPTFLFGESRDLVRWIFVTWSWIMWPASWFGRKDTRLADWIWCQRLRPLGCVDEIPSSFRDKTSELAIHNPHYRQQSRVCKGGTDITFYWEVG